MHDKLNLGLIGCGAFAKGHLESVKRIPNAEFTAYCDVLPAAAEAYLKEFGGRYATSDPQRIFDDPAIDAVHICTRHDTHTPLAIGAARAGKHIFIEKPLALSLANCKAIARAVEKAGVFLMPGFKNRFEPLIQRAREFIPRPQLVVGQMMCERWADDYWAQDPVQGGANVLSQGCHTTDLLRYLSGAEPVRILASGGTITHPGHPCVDLCAATIEFANGVFASWIQGDLAETPFTSKYFFEVFGEGKSVQLYDRLKKAVFFDGKRSWTEERPTEEGVFLENCEFIRALSEKRPPVVTVYDGIQAMRMALEAVRSIKRSSKEGRRLSHAA